MNPNRRGADERLPRRAALACALIALVACLSGPNVTNYDSYLAVPVAWSVLRERNLDLDEYGDVALVVDHHGYRSIDGHAYDFYPWPTDLLAVPFVGLAWLGSVVGIVASPSDLIRSNEMDGIQLLAAATVVAAAAAVMAMVAFECGRGLSARRSVAVGVAFVVASMMWSTASRALWQHGPAALFLAIGLLGAQRFIRAQRDATGPSARHAALAAAACAAACITRPTAAVAAAGLGAAMAWSMVASSRRPAAARRAELAAAVGGASAVFVPFVVVNVAVFSAVVPEPYRAGRLAIHAEYGEALLANLVSPARGLLVSCPIVVVALAAIAWRRWRGERPDALTTACTAALVVHWLVVSAGAQTWWAGHSYGARFFTEMTPLIAYLALPLVPSAAPRVSRVSGAPEVPGVSETAAEAEPSVEGPSPGTPSAQRPWWWAAAVAVVLGVAFNVPGVYLRATNCWNTDPTDIDTDHARIWSWSAPPYTFAATAVADGLPLRQAVLGPCPPPG